MSDRLRELTLNTRFFFWAKEFRISEKKEENHQEEERRVYQ